MDTLPLRSGGNARPFFADRPFVAIARLVLLALFCPVFASAMHIIGGDMTYKYLSTNPATGAKTF